MSCAASAWLGKSEACSFFAIFACSCWSSCASSCDFLFSPILLLELSEVIELPGGLADPGVKAGCSEVITKKRKNWWFLLNNSEQFDLFKRCYKCNGDSRSLWSRHGATKIEFCNLVCMLSFLYIVPVHHAEFTHF